MISTHIKTAIKEFKTSLESAITTATNGDKTFANGQLAKESLIRSSRLINLIHEAIKLELIDEGIDSERIFPPLNSMSPELKIAGFLKQKNQDISIIPENTEKSPRQITWGPLQFENQTDPYGQEFSEETLIINLRSQMSSLAKNADTLFERTFAEPMNLHLIYPKMVLGEVYLIPLVEYDDAAMVNNEVKFKSSNTNIVKYISFFSALSGRRNSDDDLHKYERCALMIVDFRLDEPKIYTKKQELIDDNLVDEDFNINFDDISISNFTKELLEIYSNRHR